MPKKTATFSFVKKDIKKKEPLSLLFFLLSSLDKLEIRFPDVLGESKSLQIPQYRSFPEYSLKTSVFLRFIQTQRPEKKAIDF